MSVEDEHAFADHVFVCTCARFSGWEKCWRCKELALAAFPPDPVSSPAVSSHESEET